MFGLFGKKKMGGVENAEMKADLSLKTIFGPEFGINDLELLETIGTGTFSRIRLVKCMKDHKYYALKVMKKAAIGTCSTDTPCRPPSLATTLLLLLTAPHHDM